MTAAMGLRATFAARSTCRFAIRVFEQYAVKEIIDRIIIGSTAERIVRSASIPVLFIPRQKQKLND